MIQVYWSLVPICSLSSSLIPLNCCFTITENKQWSCCIISKSYKDTIWEHVPTLNTLACVGAAPTTNLARLYGFCHRDFPSCKVSVVTSCTRVYTYNQEARIIHCQSYYVHNRTATSCSLSLWWLYKCPCMKVSCDDNRLIVLNSRLLRAVTKLACTFVWLNMYCTCLLHYS